MTSPFEGLAQRFDGLFNGETDAPLYHVFVFSAKITNGAARAFLVDQEPRPLSACEWPLTDDQQKELVPSAACIEELLWRYPGPGTLRYEFLTGCPVQVDDLLGVSLLMEPVSKTTNYLSRKIPELIRLAEEAAVLTKPDKSSIHGEMPQAQAWFWSVGELTDYLDATVDVAESTDGPGNGVRFTRRLQLRMIRDRIDVASRHALRKLDREHERALMESVLGSQRLAPPGDIVESEPSELSRISAELAAGPNAIRRIHHDQQEAAAMAAAGEDVSKQVIATDELTPESPTGFLGGEVLSNALGVHVTRRAAFFRQLERRRRSLGDCCWHEVLNPRPNSPRFLYRADSPKLRDLAAGYNKPKPA